MRTPQEIKDEINAVNEEALTADGFDEALIGVCYRACSPAVACYDYDKCISILVNRDGMEQEEAIEFFEFNTLGAFVGDNTPVFVKLFT